MSSVTINDVATLAGVSIKTVSRVLNGEAHVRPAMRERVREAVSKLNYTPNVAARALAGLRAYLIGLYYDNPSSSYVSSVQVGAMAACREAGYHLLVEHIQEGATRAQLETLLSAVSMDGLILPAPVCERTELLDALDARRLPYVRIAPAGQLDRGPYVYMDDRRAAFAMTAYLQSLGHRRIGFIKGQAEHAAASLRYQGFLDAMQIADLEVSPQWIVSGSFSFRSGAGAAEHLLGLPQPPTAIFASNDDMALGVMAVANRMQINVPKALSVGGFDDSPIAQVVWPQLTTVRQPIEAMAMEAGRVLIQEVGGPVQGGARLLDYELIVRGSTGPAPGNAAS